MENGAPPVFDYLESQLDEGSETLLSRFSVADIAVGCQLYGLVLGGESIDSARWPKLAAYAQALHSRPAFKAASPA